MKYDPKKRVQWVALRGFSLSLGGFMWDPIDRMFVILFPLGFTGLLILLKDKKRKGKQ